MFYQNPTSPLSFKIGPGKKYGNVWTLKYGGLLASKPWMILEGNNADKYIRRAKRISKSAGI